MKKFAETTTPPLLEVRNLSLRFKKKDQLAIDRVSFSIKQGSTLGLVGASGAGKSSIARAIVRLLEPESGDILFNGENILKMTGRKLRATRQRIQVVFQEPSASLSPRRTVEQILMEPLAHFEIGATGDRHDKVRQILNTVGLDQDVLQRYPHQFSSGQQQRIAIARALVTNPDLLIADEAVSSLDVSIQAQILQLIQHLQKEHGISFLFISHDLAVIRQIADDVAVMYRGQMLEQSPADIFFSEPAHPYSEALLAFANDEIPEHLAREKWYLEHGRISEDIQPACVFACNCPKKIPVCSQFEPASSCINTKNRHALQPQRVKCHLYDEANNHDEQKNRF